jgi:hypothetical protein
MRGGFAGRGVLHPAAAELVAGGRRYERSGPAESGTGKRAEWVIGAIFGRGPRGCRTRVARASSGVVTR